MESELGRSPDRTAWVPMAARSYLGYVTGGRSFRELARLEGVHPSTILRQVRRIEERRDDPLIDAAITALGRSFTPPGNPDDLGAIRPDPDAPGEARRTAADGGGRAHIGRGRRARGRQPLPRAGGRRDAAPSCRTRRRAGAGR